MILMTVLLFAVGSFAAETKNEETRKPNQTGDVGKGAQLFAQNACNPVQYPQVAECDLSGDTYGSKFKEKISVKLLNNKGKTTGDITDKYSARGTAVVRKFPSSIGNKPNLLSIDVTSEVHGNSNNCEVQQFINGKLQLARLSLPISRYVEYKSGDTLQLNEFNLKMSCIIK